MKRLLFVALLFNVLFFMNSYEETGLASWYGPNFHGKKTASGEIFNTYDYTAAHKTLPFGTYVKVISVENGREVIVRINDRGPFAESRIIDLSKAAANELGLINQGVMNVKIAIHRPNDNEPVMMEDLVGKAIELKIAPADDSTHIITTTDSITTGSTTADIKITITDEYIYDLQLGSFKTYHYAQDLTVKVDKLMNVKPIITNVNINNVDMYRVIIPNLTKAEVDRYLELLNKNNIDHFVKKKKNNLGE